MHNLNLINSKHLYQFVDTCHQIQRLAQIHCRTPTWKDQSNDETFSKRGFTQCSRLWSAHSHLTASGNTLAASWLQKEDKAAIPLAALPLFKRKDGSIDPRDLPSATRLATRLEELPYSRFRGVAKPASHCREYEGVALYPLNLSSRKAVPRCIGKFVNRLMRHGKKGIAIGLLARSLVLFFKRLQENNDIALRRGQLRVCLPQTPIGNRNLPAFPFGEWRSQPTISPSPAGWLRHLPTSETGSLTGGWRSHPLQPLDGYPHHRTFARHLDQGRLRHLPITKGPPRFKGVLREGVWLSRRSSVLHHPRTDTWEVKAGLDSRPWDKVNGLLYLNLWPNKGWRCAPFTNQDRGKGWLRHLPISKEVEDVCLITSLRKANPLQNTSFRVAMPSPDQPLYRRRLQTGRWRSHPQGVLSLWTSGEHSPLADCKMDAKTPPHPHVNSPVFHEELAPVHRNPREEHRRGAFNSSRGVGWRSHPGPKEIPRDLFVIDYLQTSIANVEPSLEVRRKKIAGITRQIPSAVPKLRGERLAIRWLVESARDKVRKRGRGLSECLADELMEAHAKRGEPRQRRDFVHRQAESNRSFMRYRWW